MSVIEFSSKAALLGWPAPLGTLWPVDTCPVSFMLHGQRVMGTLHHINSKTTWVRYQDRVLKRHTTKHQVDWINH